MGAGGDGAFGRTGEARGAGRDPGPRILPRTLRGDGGRLGPGGIRRRGDQGGTSRRRSAPPRGARGYPGGRHGASLPLRGAQPPLRHPRRRRLRRAGPLPAPRPLRGRDHHDRAAGAHGGHGVRLPLPSRGTPRDRLSLPLHLRRVRSRRLPSRAGQRHPLPGALRGPVHRRGAGARRRPAAAAPGADPPRELARVHSSRGFGEPTGSSRRFITARKPERARPWTFRAPSR